MPKDNQNIPKCTEKVNAQWKLSGHSGILLAGAKKVPKNTKTYQKCPKRAENYYKVPKVTNVNAYWKLSEHNGILLAGARFSFWGAGCHVCQTNEACFGITKRPVAADAAFITGERRTENRKKSPKIIHPAIQKSSL